MPFSSILSVNILNPSGTIALDINKDGLMDFITGQTKIRNSKIKPKIYAFVNTFNREKRKSFRFYLNGVKGNAHGLGSMLTLKTNNKVIKKWNETIYGPLPSQNEFGIHVGIGEDRPLSVKVSWPVLEAGNGSKKRPLVKTYSLKKFQKKNHYELTLCESGKIKIGNKKCQ